MKTRQEQNVSKDALGPSIIVLLEGFVAGSGKEGARGIDVFHLLMHVCMTYQDVFAVCFRAFFLSLLCTISGTAFFLSLLCTIPS